jgi:hypothetical protein
MNHQKFYILLFLLNLCAYRAENIVSLKTAYRAQEYNTVTNLYEKYQSRFQDPEALGITAHSYRKLNLYTNCVLLCAKSFTIEKTTLCSQLLSEMRKQHRKAYDLGIAQFYMETNQIEKAYPKLCKLVLKSPEDPVLKNIYIQALFSQQKLALAMQQIRSLNHLEPVIKKLKQTIEMRGDSLNNSFQRMKNKLQPQYSEELFLLLTIKNMKDQKTIDYLKRLLYFQSDSLGYSDKNAYEYATLLYLENSYIQAIKYLDSVNDKVRSPIYRVAIQTLRCTIGEILNPTPKAPPTLEEKRLAQKMWEIQNPHLKEKPKEKTTPPVLKKIPVKPAGEVNQKHHDNYFSFDIADLSFSSAEDLSAYKDVHRQFAARLDKNPPLDEIRWMIYQITSATQELKENQSTKDALKAYKSTPDGRKFNLRIQKLKTKIENQNRVYAAKFKGEATRLKTALEKGKTIRQKQTIFLSYISKWKKMYMGKNTSLALKGAAEEYAKTDEGQELYKLALELASELQLEKKQIPRK